MSAARSTRAPVRAALSALLAAAAAAGCRQDMHDQPRYEPFEASDFFDDGRSARPLVVGTVARGFLNEDQHLHRGRIGGELADRFPFAVDRTVLERGRERYGIYCWPCHGATGDGHGIITRRGYPNPPSYHIPRLVQAPDRHFMDVIRDGYGVMYSYAARVAPADRWAMVAYIRALQLSQDADASALADEDRAALEEVRR